jgi:L-2-hydroxyglutarate oxidase LhgO
MAERVDCVVIGAGAVGLACAATLAERGREVLVLEQHERIGSETSSRNSEVIHAGIYYAPGSLKAALCVRGKSLLYAHCAAMNVPHRRCGKIIVATAPEQMSVLEGYRRTAAANGAGELPWLTQADVAVLEPEVASVGGILSESTGIIDSHAYMESLVARLEAAGGIVALRTKVTHGREAGECIELHTDDLVLAAKSVVNSAGLHAPGLAANLPHGGLELPEARYAIGHYYTLSGRAPFGRLVYPIAEAAGLGVHVTLDLAGQARFGPDVRWLDSIDYRFDDRERGAFVAAIRRYYPGLDESRLQPGYTGIRPKLAGAGTDPPDFLILGPQQHGVAGIVHLLGIESPGLTASLAIAERVAAMLGAH